MSRHHLDFLCGSHRLGATLDTAPGTTGLLIVTGGNEVRAGAFNGQSRLAADIADAGYPVFRFDRRGVGDSEGENRGFRNSAKDLRCALEAFRALVPAMNTLVAFGNCDAASALMLNGGSGADALVLSNPWTVEDAESDDPQMPPSAVRARYAEKLRNPREIARLVGGGVDLRKLAGGLVHALRPKPTPSSLAAEMAAGLADFTGSVRILIAEADRTAKLFAANWDGADPRLFRCPGAGHAYAEPHAAAWLKQQLLDALSA